MKGDFATPHSHGRQSLPGGYENRMRLLKQSGHLLGGGSIKSHRIRLRDGGSVVSWTCPTYLRLIRKKLVKRSDGLTWESEGHLPLGEPGIGKSYLALKLIVSCCRGTEFLGQRCEQIPCLLLDRENPLAIVRERLIVLTDSSVPGPPLWGGWNAEAPPDLGDPMLLEIAANEKPLMILDSLVRFHEADMNSASEMRLVMAHPASWQTQAPRLYERMKSHEGSNYRGSSDILAAVDLAYVLKSDGPATTAASIQESLWFAAHL